MPRGRKRHQADHRADLRGKPFIGLPAAVLYSPAYTSLGLPARAVLTEILGRFNGYNNGEIAISYRELGERLRTSNARLIARAIEQLLLAGLIDISADAKWKQRQARLYRLTFVSTGKAPPYTPATNDYANIPREAFSRADNASAEKSRFAERASAGTLGLADDASAAMHAFPSIGDLAAADDASTLICKPYQGTNGTGIGAPSNLIGFPSKSGGCEACGQTFAPGSRGKPKRFCSERCRRRAETQRRLQRQRHARSA